MSDDQLDQSQNVSPNLPTAAERPALAAMPALGMFVLFLLGQILVAAPLQMANVAFGLIFAGVFVFAVPPVLFLRAANLSPRAFLRLLPATPAQIGLGFAIGAANFLVAGMLQFTGRRLVPESWLKQFDPSHIFRDATGFELGLIMLAVGVSAPICEEIAFRGYLQNAFRGRYRDLTAVVLSAILFSSLHLDPVGLVARIELGVLFGLLAVWSGSLLPAIAAHMANNLIASGLFLAAVSSDGSQASASEPNVLFVLGGAAVSAVATWLLIVRFRAAAATPAQAVPFIVPVESEGDHRIRPSRALRPLLLSMLVAMAALAVFAVADWRGVRISVMADTLLPQSAIKQRIPDELERETLERLRQARRRARAGEVEFDRYLALRRALHGPATKPGEERQLLTAEEIELAFARFEGRADPEPAEQPDAGEAANGDAVPEELAPGLPPVGGNDAP